MAATSNKLATYVKTQVVLAPRKAAFLALLALVLVIMGVVHLVNRPTEATASIPAAPPPIEQPGATMTDPASPVAEAPKRSPLPALPRRLARDPFALDASLYPELGPEPVVPEPDEHDELTADELSLDATITLSLDRSTHRAIINGVSMHVGNRIGGFVLEEIGPRHVVLRDRDRRIVLEMR